MRDDAEQLGFGHDGTRTCLPSADGRTATVLFGDSTAKTYRRAGGGESDGAAPGDRNPPRDKCHSRLRWALQLHPGHRASVWSARDDKLIRKTFPTLAAAKAWRRTQATPCARGAAGALVHASCGRQRRVAGRGRGRRGPARLRAALQALNAAGLRAGAPGPHPAAGDYRLSSSAGPTCRPW